GCPAFVPGFLLGDHGRSFFKSQHCGWPRRKAATGSPISQDLARRESHYSSCFRVGIRKIVRAFE
ncbi:MAG: hypothetical protein J7530_16845, partial [Novosphingobium sp.]|nr:hypothetical protein [Novosphingobium sp.]